MGSLMLILKIPIWIFRSRLVWFLLGSFYLSSGNIDRLGTRYMSVCRETIVIDDNDYVKLAKSYLYYNYPGMHDFQFNSIQYYIPTGGSPFGAKKMVVQAKDRKNNETRIIDMSMNSCGFVLYSTVRDK